jgi:hypothetical protein
MQPLVEQVTLLAPRWFLELEAAQLARLAEAVRTDEVALAADLPEMVVALVEMVVIIIRPIVVLVVVVPEVTPETVEPVVGPEQELAVLVVPQVEVVRALLH